MQTTSGKVKLATAEEVDNMASSISGCLGGTLIGTTTAYINVGNGKKVTATVPYNTDYVVIKPINLNGSGAGNDSNWYAWFFGSIGRGTIVYNNGSGWVPAAAAATTATTATAATAAATAAAAIAAAAVTFNAPTVTFTSKCSESYQYVYVNIEAYKFN